MSILGEKRLQATRDKTKAEVELDQEAVAQAGWGVPMAFGRFTPPPAFPVDILPRWWQDFVVETAEALQVPVDAPAMLSLAAIAGGFGGRIRYRIREGWSKNANLYIVVAMSPGERKSAVFRAVNAPIFAAEKMQGS